MHVWYVRIQVYVNVYVYYAFIMLQYWACLAQSQKSTASFKNSKKDITKY